MTATSMQRLLRLFGKRRGRSFFAWQVELTTRCPLRCRMCIRSATREWQAGDMRIEDFKKLAPYFENVDTVVLEGWGEPLLHEHLIDAVKLVKGAGARAGFVTSGWGLTSDYGSDLAGAGVDFIGFSLAGAKPATHNAIRVNSDLQNVLNAIQGLNRLKRDRGLDTPRLHIVFLMLRDNLAEVPLLPRLAVDIGVRDVVLINLIQIANAWQESQRVFTCGEGEDQSLIEEAEANAKELGIRLRKDPSAPTAVAVCAENPLTNLYVSVEGEVTSCVYLYPPVRPPFTRMFCGREYKVEKLSFGNIFQEPLESIWEKAAYREFRECFRRRKRSFEQTASPLFWPAANLRGPGDSAPPEPPEPCRICHKMLGL